jgi:hypothetical protein
MTTLLSPDTARQLGLPLRQVCAQIGADSQQAQLIKYTMNAVFRVGPYVVRLGRGAVAGARAAVNCSAARALVDAGVPFIEPAVDHPVHAGEWVATVWHYVPTVAVAAEPVDLVVPLRAIHALTSAGPDLPVWDPIRRSRLRIDEAGRLPDADREYLDRWARKEAGMPADALLAWLAQHADELGAELASVSWAFPASVMHGDAHTGNLLLRSEPVRPAADPTAVICDPDGLSIGRREWDYSSPAHGVTRFGRSRHQYDLFASGVGFDVTSWAGWPVLSRVRDLTLVTATIGTLTGRPGVSQELGVRVRSLLRDDCSVVWSRHG